MEQYNFIDKGTGQKLAYGYKIGEDYTVIDMRKRIGGEKYQELSKAKGEITVKLTPEQIKAYKNAGYSDWDIAKVIGTTEGTKFTGKITSGIEGGLTEEQVKKEQEDLKKKVAEIVGEKLTYEQSEALIKQAYESKGHEIIITPAVSVKERAELIINNL